MKLVFRTVIVAAALAAHSGLHAQSSLLRVTCEGDDIGAEVTVNGQLKGTCPLDIEISAGAVKLRAVKKTDAARESVFEQDFSIGAGATKRVEVVLAGDRRHAGELRYLHRQPANAQQSVASIAAFKLSPAYKTTSPGDAAEIVRILTLPIEDLRNVTIEGEANIRAFVASDAFFAVPDGSRRESGPLKHNGPVAIVATFSCAGKDRYVQAELRLEHAGKSATGTGTYLLGGLVVFQASLPQTRVETGQLASVYGQPFPLTHGKRFGVTATQIKSGSGAGTSMYTHSCAVSAESERRSGTQSIAVACLEQVAGDPASFVLRRYIWSDTGGCFVRLSL